MLFLTSWSKQTIKLKQSRKSKTIKQSQTSLKADLPILGHKSPGYVTEATNTKYNGFAKQLAKAARRKQQNARALYNRKINITSQFIKKVKQKPFNFFIKKIKPKNH
jgi:hypothetical protein